MRGPMLAGYRDPTGKPTAGIRLRIPTYLMGAFKTLETFGHRLKKSYGQQFRKHIKFDDFSRDLYIQVGIKAEGETTEWTQYSATEAREANKKANNKTRSAGKIDFLASPPPANKDSGQTGRRTATGTRKRTATTEGPPTWVPPQKDRRQSEMELSDEEGAE